MAGSRWPMWSWNGYITIRKEDEGKCDLDRRRESVMQGKKR
jgi:hypothetical protein